MNREDIEILVKYRVDRADISLKEARLLLDNGFLNGAVSSIYYAMFYIANAALVAGQKKLRTNKPYGDHYKVYDVFNKEYIYSGLIDKEYGGFYRTILDNRQESDYRDPVEFKKEEVSEWLETANKFVDEVERLAHRLIAV